MKERDDIEMSEWLKEKKKTNPFKVPEGYFANLEEQLISTHDFSKERHEVKHFQLGVWKYAVAAVFVGLIIVAGFQLSELGSSNEVFADVSEIEYLDLEENLDRFQTSDLISLLSDQDLLELEQNLYNTKEEFLEESFIDELDDEDLESLFLYTE